MKNLSRLMPLLAVAAFITFSCTGILPSANNGALRLSINQGQPRSTILPPSLLETDIDNYEITLSGIAPTVSLAAPLVVPKASIAADIASIPAGTYSLSVAARDAANNVLGRSAAQDITVNPSLTTAVNVTIVPVQTGNGRLTAQYDWPAGLLDSATLDIVKLDGVDTPYPYDPSLFSVNVATGSASLDIAGMPSGYYELRFKIYKAGVVQTTVYSVAHVYDFRTSSGTFVLTSADFSHTVNLAVGFDLPSQPDTTVTTDTVFSLEPIAGSSMAAHAPSGYASYEWFINGTKRSVDPGTKDFTIGGADPFLRMNQINHLLLLVTDGSGNTYSATLPFMVKTPFDGGDGVDSPYVISTAAQLDRMRYYCGNTFILANDIDLSAFGNWTPLMNPIGPSNFYGSIDGAGHKITGMVVPASWTANGGFIGEIEGTAAAPCIIENLTIENASVSNDGAGGSLGILAGRTGAYTTIRFCFASGTVDSIGTDAVGGLIGQATLTTIEDCGVSGAPGTVVRSNQYYIGGLVGYQNSTVIRRSFSTVDVISLSPGGPAGGLVGKADGTLDSGTIMIEQSYAQGNVSGQTAGGLLGVLEPVGMIAEIRNCYATGRVSGSDVGGLLGQELTLVGHFNNCYATGRLTGGVKGGLSSSGINIFTACYWYREGTGDATSGNTGSMEPLDPAQIFAQGSYSGWNINDVGSIWVLDEGKSLPAFRWQGNVNLPKVPRYNTNLLANGTFDGGNNISPWTMDAGGSVSGWAVKYGPDTGWHMVASYSPSVRCSLTQSIDIQQHGFLGSDLSSDYVISLSGSLSSADATGGDSLQVTIKLLAADGTTELASLPLTLDNTGNYTSWEPMTGGSMPGGEYAGTRYIQVIIEGNNAVNEAGHNGGVRIDNLELQIIQVTS